MVDFPTPPLAEDTAITLRTSRTLRCSGSPRWRRGSSGGAPERGKPSGFSCCRSLNVETSLLVIISTYCMVLEGSSTPRPKIGTRRPKAPSLRLDLLQFPRRSLSMTAFPLTQSHPTLELEL